MTDFLNRKDVINEFNQNYRTYLENNLLINILTDLLINPNSSLNHCSSTSSIESSKYDQTTNIQDKLKENFLKSYLISNSLEKPNDLIEDLKIEPFNTEAKEFLINKIENKLENYLKQLDECLDLNKEVYLSETKWNLESDEADFIKDNQEENSFEFSYKKVNQDQLLVKFNSLIECVSKDENEMEKLNSDLNIKIEHCLNTSIEIVNTLKTILCDYKIKFYDHKNKIECQNALLSCDLLLSKIESVQNELLSDLYSSDKIKCLSIIKNHINIDMNIAKEKLVNIEDTLNMFKLFGQEFDSILNTYLEAKSQHESKQWTLNKLKEESQFL